MKHYICTGGCNGVSSHPGVCQAEFCPKKGEPLSECNCADGKHHEGHEKELHQKTPKA